MSQIGLKTGDVDLDFQGQIGLETGKFCVPYLLVYKSRKFIPK